MSFRTIQLLHVEDDLCQRRFMAHHLASMNDLRFEIRYVASESDAIHEFEANRPEFVILDYHLEQGDGLSCLNALRARDAIVPIIAVSGVATDEVASELMLAGADDYIAKQDLTSTVLASSVNEALTRADALRKRFAMRQVLR